MSENSTQTSKPTREDRNGPYHDFTVRIPDRALRAIERIAAHRDMSCQALAREYLSHGLMADGIKMFSETAMRVVEEVLTEERGPDEQAVERTMTRIRERLRS